MGIALNDFKAKVQDVARPNRFLFSFASPVAGADAETISYLCKGAQLPSKTIGEIILNWQGMEAKIAGDPKFEPLTLTFINDYEQAGRTTFESWMKFIADQSTNERESQTDYKVDATVQLLGRKGETLATFKMYGAWPQSMDAVDLNTESTDQMSEFGITLGMDYWERI